MKRSLLAGVAACAALVVGVASVPAQSVDDAVKTFAAVGVDPAKLKLFCELDELLDRVGEKEDPALEKQIEETFAKLGAEFAAAWEASEKAVENTPEGKKLYDALSALQAKCT